MTACGQRTKREGDAQIKGWIHNGEASTAPPSTLPLAPLPALQPLRVHAMVHGPQPRHLSHGFVCASRVEKVASHQTGRPRRSSKANEPYHPSSKDGEWDAGHARVSTGLLTQAYHSKANITMTGKEATTTTLQMLERIGSHSHVKG